MLPGKEIREGDLTGSGQKLDCILADWNDNLVRLLEMSPAHMHLKVHAAIHVL